jgi:transposase
MSVKTVGLDLAKDVFQVHGISENGRVIFNKAIKRAKLLAFFETLPPCVIGMEACGSSHHWGRTLRKLGHDVRLMPANYVKPYVKRGKTDVVDVEAILLSCQTANNAVCQNQNRGPAGRSLDPSHPRPHR